MCLELLKDEVLSEVSGGSYGKAVGNGFIAPAKRFSNKLDKFVNGSGEERAKIATETVTYTGLGIAAVGVTVAATLGTEKLVKTLKEKGFSFKKLINKIK